jgi:LPXTG-motif cell wall-anchored protein
VTTTTPTVSPTTIPGTLPETGGGGSGALPTAGAVLVLFGAAVLAVTAFRRPERTG